MPKFCTDEEFIQAWHRLKSAKKVADHFGMGVRPVYSRRRTLEARHNISLQADSEPTAPNSIKTIVGKKIEELAETRVRIYERDIPIECTDGVVMVASDCHYWPGIVTDAHQAFCRLARALKPQCVILNGDILDGARISRHDRSMWQKLPTVKEEIHAVQDRCAEIERAAGKATLIRTIGNHDARFENYLCRMTPELEEMDGTTLLHYLPRWQACWAVHINPDTDGWTVVRHRPVSGGIHAAYNSTLRSGTNYVHGHLHKLQVTPWADYRGRRYGVDTGTLAEPKGAQFDYTEAGPLNWASGFVVLTFHEGKLLQPEMMVIEHGKPWFRGQMV
jgi:hypothetical protein